VILTVGNTKGGVGKTTLAVNVAIARAMAGRDVWLIDADRQGTAMAAAAVRSEAETTPPLAASFYPDGAALRGQVKAQAGKFEDVIIDAGGRDSTALRAALVLSDALLIPFAPRSFDVWALNDIAELVGEARAVRDGLRAFAVLNLADPGAFASDNHDAQEVAGQIEGIELLPVVLRRRKAFSNAAGTGQCVLEYKPHDARACKELSNLIKIVF
jgi:chromosome partitioning protein